MDKFKVGDRVTDTCGYYCGDGTVIEVSSQYLVEHDDGCVRLYSEANLTKKRTKYDIVQEAVEECRGLPIPPDFTGCGRGCSIYPCGTTSLGYATTNGCPAYATAFFMALIEESKTCA